MQNRSGTTQRSPIDLLFVRFVPMYLLRKQPKMSTVNGLLKRFIFAYKGCSNIKRAPFKIRGFRVAFNVLENPRRNLQI